MPKFLDAPSWYDNEGSQRTIVTTMRIGMSNTGRRGYCNVPVISEGSASLDDIPEQPLYTLPFGSTNTGGVPYWSGTQNGYQLVAQGTSGQVLRSNGIAAPGWTNLSDLITITPLYCHKGYYWRQTPFCRVVYTYYSNSAIEASSVSDLANGLRLIGATSGFSQLSCTGSCAESSGGNHYSIQGIHASSTVNQLTISYYTDTGEDSITTISGTVEEHVDKIN